MKSPRTKKWLREGIRIETANKLNKVFDLRKQGYTQREIAEELKLTHSQVNRDLAVLERAVVAPRTKQLLREGIRRKTAQKQNRVFDLRKQGYTQGEIAKEMKRSRTQIQRYLTGLENAVERTETKKMLRGKRGRKQRKPNKTMQKKE